MKIMIINGPNLNMIGLRDNNHYGSGTYKQLIDSLVNYCGEKNIECTPYQSNHEGQLIDYIHQAICEKYDGIVINPGAYTHYSYAIRDALEIANCLKVEVHISNIKDREAFRKISVIEDVVDFSIIGRGQKGYIEAIKYISKNIGEIDIKSIENLSSIDKNR